VKILRAIQERKVTRLGGVKGLPVDVRIVAATNRDLEAMVRDGLFREDLYYRVNVVRIRLPPLRERPGDARALAEHFVVSLGPRMGRRGMRLSAEALKAIEAYPFPGNVRELSNLVERALILADGEELTPADFQFGHASDVRSSRDSDTSAGTEEPLPLAEIEKRAILAALRRNGGKREATATELGITRRTLFNKLNEYGYRD
ncbi:MAG TPA: sigma 54-interacting transcriptional regulator, partial [Spirochaetales bacterium]|nr:sigma 54-interacting transcriptional regulator [Spirochaetales bacterium]